MTRARLRTAAVSLLGAVIVVIVALLVRNGPPAAHEPIAAVRAVRSGHVHVKITNYAFSPAKLTVAAGTRITFTNYDSTAHTATADHGGFGTGTVEPHQSRTIRIIKPGTYPYHCIFHAFMTGTITVTKR